MEENTSRPTPCARIASSRLSVPVDVVVPVALGVLDRLGDERERGEVQHAVEAARRARRAQRVRVEQVDLGVPGAGGDRAGVAAREVVEHGDLVAGGEQLLGDDGADVARAAGDQELHAGRILEWRGCGCGSQRRSSPSLIASAGASPALAQERPARAAGGLPTTSRTTASWTPARTRRARCRRCSTTSTRDGRRHARLPPAGRGGAGRAHRPGTAATSPPTTRRTWPAAARRTTRPARRGATARGATGGRDRLGDAAGAGRRRAAARRRPRRTTSTRSPPEITPVPAATPAPAVPAPPARGDARGRLPQRGRRRAARAAGAGRAARRAGAPGPGLRRCSAASPGWTRGSPGRAARGARRASGREAPGATSRTGCGWGDTRAARLRARRPVPSAPRSTIHRPAHPPTP